ncbi:MAG: hypothetical protein PWP42_790 [Candidatus Atribacteria bacterium]|jgi:hypothetical protein|nr:hypothetical protein [Candidatus Atribacteria bacterium]
MFCLVRVAFARIFKFLSRKVPGVEDLLYLHAFSS